ncbi:hypothetical protein PSEUDO8Z_90062 [Pseudomonas sp. 8Z]|nr:hypothetical protein PSEUDO8Z_90062 [Pseudomonas sp. 8Z]
MKSRLGRRVKPKLSFAQFHALGSLAGFQPASRSALGLTMFKNSVPILGYLWFRRVQSPPRRVNGIVVEEVERHGCRESHGGPWMAHRGGPLERRWSERTLAQPGPDERAEVLVTFACKSDSPRRAKREPSAER